VHKVIYAPEFPFAAKRKEKVEITEQPSEVFWLIDK
jgi:hypothetical protein